MPVNKNSSPYGKDYGYQQPPQPYQHHPFVNNLVQQQEPPSRKGMSFFEIEKQHEHYIQLIVAEEEDLIKAH